MSNLLITNLKSICLVATSLFLLCSGLTSCTSKEQALKERTATLEKFASAVTENIFDRNPVTIKQSMNTLTREQLSEKALNKLQSAREIPETELDVLKIIDDNQNQHRTNKVKVESVSPLGPVEKDPVSLKVSGRDTPIVNGKNGADKPFSIVVTCQLSDEMGGYPRVVDVTGLTSTKPANAEKPAVKTVKAATPKHRRHH